MDDRPRSRSEIEQVEARRSDAELQADLARALADVRHPRANRDVIVGGRRGWHGGEYGLFVTYRTPEGRTYEEWLWASEPP